MAARNVKLFALSVDTKGNHRRWIEDVEELQDCKITFPLFADVDGSVSRVYGLVRPGTVGNAAKSVISAGLIVIIDLDKRIRFISQYPSSTGRNFYEVLRVIDTLQLTLFHSVATPANWMQVRSGEERKEATSVRVAKRRAELRRRNIHSALSFRSYLPHNLLLCDSLRSSLTLYGICILP